MSPMRNFARAYILAGLLGASLVIFLDSMAIFSLFSYIPLYGLALGYGATGVWLATRETRTEKRAKLTGFVTLTMALSSLALCLALPTLRTSPRKAFHVRAASIRPGMSIALIENKMAGYAIQREQGYTAFVFRVDAHTEDRVIVDLAADHTARKIEVVTN